MYLITFIASLTNLPIINYKSAIKMKGKIITIRMVLLEESGLGNRPEEEEGGNLTISIVQRVL